MSGSHPQSTAASWKKDLVREAGVRDSEIFCESGYDSDESYNAMLRADVEREGYSVTLYDNLYPSYSPKSKNTLNIMVLQGYEPWKKKALTISRITPCILSEARIPLIFRLE